jgi:hypothetical protein
MDVPESATLPEEQTQLIGGTLYGVSIIAGKSFAAPGSPPVGGTGLAGSYSLNVHSVSAQPVPAPATALGGLVLLAELGPWKATRNARVVDRAR